MMHDQRNFAAPVTQPGEADGIEYASGVRRVLGFCAFVAVPAYEASGWPGEPKGIVDEAA